MPQNPSILVVSEDPKILNAVARALQCDGCVVQSVATAGDGLRLARERQPDLLLVDAGELDTHGSQLLRQLRETEDTRFIPVIFLSDQNKLPPEIAQEIETGTVDLVKHPADDQELLARARHHLKQRERDKTLQNSERRARNLIDNHGDGMLVIDQGGAIRFANPTAAKLLGRDQQALENTLFGFPISRGKREIEIIAINGHLIPCEMRASETTWDGDPAWIVSLSDISGRIAVETAVYEEREKERQQLCAAQRDLQFFRSLFDHTLIPCLALDVDTYRIRAVNQAFLSATTTKREQIEGKLLFEALPNLPNSSEPAGSKRLRASLEQVRTTGTADSMAIQHYPLRLPTGDDRDLSERYWTISNSPVVGSGGSVEFILHRIKDVTVEVETHQESGKSISDLDAGNSQQMKLEADLIQRSQQLEKAFSQLEQNRSLLEIGGRVARIGGWKIDLPGRELSWSNEIRAIHEVPDDYQPTLENAIDFYPTEYREMVRSLVEGCASDGTPFDFELKIITARGRRIPVRSIGKAIRDDTDRISGIQGAFQDLTEWEASGASIAEAEQRFRELADSLPVFIWSAWPDGDINFINDEFNRYCGVSPQESPATRWQKTIHPDDLPGTLEKWQRSFRGETLYQHEFRIRRHDGHYRWYRVQARPVRDAKGRVWQWFGSGLDIHPVKELQEKSDAMAAETRRILESITDAFFALDADWRFSYTNSQLEALLQRSRQQLVGKPIWDFFSDTSTDPFAQALRRAREENATVTVEGHHPGIQQWIEMRIYPRAEGLAVYARDITTDYEATARLRDSEARFRTLLQDIPSVAVQSVNTDLTVLFWNKASEKMFGYRSEEAIGKNILDLIVPDAAKADMPRLTAELLESQTHLPPAEWSLHRKDGTSIDILSTQEVLKLEGKPAEIFSFAIDLTDRKQLEAQFLRAQRLENIGALASGIAHDFNNLLSPIVMGVTLMRRLDREERFKQLIDTIEKSAEHGSRLVKQILSFARGVEGARIPLSVRHLVRETETIVRDTFPKNIFLKSDIPKSLWLVSGDPTQLNQIFLNLCVNARDAMPEGGSLALNGENREIDKQYAANLPEVKPGKYAVIEVRDTGVGMSRKVIDQIFDPFFTTKELGSGTGLGLSTTLNIVRSHGGFIDVSSEPGKGSSFKIFLPAAEDTSEYSKTNKPGNQPLHFHGSGECILVVDDEPSILKITCQTLEISGYRTLAAEDGAHAVALYASRRAEIALVVTDIMMPVLDGKALIQSLRKINPDVKIIAASGLKESTSFQSEDRSAILGFLAKPFTADQLLAEIAHALHA